MDLVPFLTVLGLRRNKKGRQSCQGRSGRFHESVVIKQLVAVVAAVIVGTANPLVTLFDRFGPQEEQKGSPKLPAGPNCTVKVDLVGSMKAW